MPYVAIGGGGGSRTHVRKTYDQSYYTVSPLINLVSMLYSGQDSMTTVPWISDGVAGVRNPIR